MVACEFRVPIVLYMHYLYIILSVHSQQYLHYVLSVHNLCNNSVLAPIDISVPLVTVTDRIGCWAEILSTN